MEADAITEESGGGGRRLVEFFRRTNKVVRVPLIDLLPWWVILILFACYVVIVACVIIPGFFGLFPDVREINVESIRENSTILPFLVL